MSNGTKIKVDKTSNYTVMSNQHFHVTNMSLRAKGLLSLILSLPDNWDYSVQGLTSLCNESYNTVKNTLDELKELGYLEINKTAPTSKETGGTGRFMYEYIIHENSILPAKLQQKWAKKEDE